MRAAALLAAVVPLIGYVAARVKRYIPNSEIDDKFAGIFDEYDTPYDMTLRPEHVVEHIRAGYCQYHVPVCDHLCGYKTIVNECDHKDFGWDCVCAHNSSMPGLEYYWMTMPNFICFTNYQLCDKFTRGKFSKQDFGSQIETPFEDRDKLIQGCEDRFLDKCGFLDVATANVLAWVEPENWDKVDMERIMANKPFYYQLEVE